MIEQIKSDFQEQNPNFRLKLLPNYWMATTIL